MDFEKLNDLKISDDFDGHGGDYRDCLLYTSMLDLPLKEENQYSSLEEQVVWFQAQLKSLRMLKSS